MTPMFRRPVLATVLFSALGLAACADIPDFREFTDYAPYEKPRPQVTAVRLSHPVAFSDASSVLSREAQEKLEAFVAAAQVDRTDGLVVSAAPEDEAKARRVLAYLLLHRLKARLDLTPAAAGEVRLHVDRHQVTLPACPDWTGPTRETFSNRPSTNFGCATATNLGLMVAHPRDLLEGRDPGSGDGTASVLAIQRYRAGQAIAPAAGQGTFGSTQTGGGS